MDTISFLNGGLSTESMDAEKVVAFSSSTEPSQKDLILDKLKAIQALKTLKQTYYWRAFESYIMNFDYKADTNLMQYMEGQRKLCQEWDFLIREENNLKQELNKT